MRAALVLAGRDLRSRLRDRSGLLAGVLAPLAIAVVVSLAFGGAGEIDVRIAVADEDGTVASAEILDAIADALGEEVEVARADDVAEARRWVDGGEVGAALVLPDGLEAAIAGGPAEAGQAGDAEVTILRVLSAEGQMTAPLVAESVASEIAARAEQASTAVAATVALTVEQRVPGSELDVDGEVELDEVALPDGVGSFEELADRVAGAEVALALTRDAEADPRLDAASYFGPSMAVLSALLVMTTAPRALVRERTQGTLARVRAAPVPAWASAAGLGISAAVVGVAAMAVLLVVMAVGLGASLGDPVGVALLSLAVVAFGGALSALIASFARTEAQVDGLSSMVVFPLALVGGHFVELHALPDGLQLLALATPNGWALRGYTALAADGASVGEIALPILVVLGFAVAIGLAALPGLRRQEV